MVFNINTKDRRINIKVHKIRTSLFEEYKPLKWTNMMKLTVLGKTLPQYHSQWEGVHCIYFPIGILGTSEPTYLHWCHFLEY